MSSETTLLRPQRLAFVFGTSALMRQWSMRDGVSREFLDKSTACNCTCTWQNAHSCTLSTLILTDTPTESVYAQFVLGVFVADAEPRVLRMCGRARHVHHVNSQFVLPLNFSQVMQQFVP